MWNRIPVYDTGRIEMRKVALLTMALGSLAWPATGLAKHEGQNGEREGGNGGGGVARSVASQQCNRERAQIGVQAFRAKYGKHAFKACVQSRLPADRAAAQQCKAERSQIGVKAFRAKYGKPHAMQHCIAQKVG
jgi:hypothetical protein